MRKIAFGLAMGLLGISSTAFAATTVGSFNVKITIVDNCVFTTGGLSDLDFGTKGVLATQLTLSSSIKVQCTNNTPYTIALDAGQAPGATTSTRQMVGPFSAKINYSLWRDAAFTQNWGNVAGTDTNGGRGTGVEVIFPIFATVPAQTTPQAGAYSDTIAVTITY